VFAAVGLALALVAGHGLILPAPGPIAGVAILEASPMRVLALGLPTALVAAAAGAAWVALAGRRIALPDDLPRPIAPPVPRRRNLAAALLPVVAMVGLLIVQTLGQIASEPFGGGPARELLIGVGRPVMLLAAGVGLCLILTWRRDAVVVAEDGWVGQAILRSAGLLLIVGAAGGFEKVLQETGMAELIAERLLIWHGGLLVPFLVAAIMKTLQGSTLVAVITAAGMVVPALGMLGLDDETGRAAATLAIGAGAMAVSHVNDGYFWLVAGTARLRVAGGLVLISVGTLVQALAAIATLAVLAAIV
jgi:GntP family gluconate:H+ symporter